MDSAGMKRKGPDSRASATREVSERAHGGRRRPAQEVKDQASGRRMAEAKARIREGARARSEALRSVDDVDDVADVATAEDAARVASAEEDIIIHLLRYAFGYDADVHALIMSKSDAMLEQGRVWTSWRAVVSYLHEHADSEILSLEGSQKQLDVLYKCKAFAVLFAYAMHRIAPEFRLQGRVPDETELGIWKQRAERLFDAAMQGLYEAVYRYYQDHANDRKAWRAAPPFLTMMP